MARCVVIETMFLVGMGPVVEEISPVNRCCACAPVTGTRAPRSASPASACTPDAPIVLRPPAPLAWIGEGEPDAGAGQVFSRLDIDRDEPVTAAKIKLEIDHTFSGDLRVALVTPGGKHLPVTAGSSDSNDIRGSFDVTLPPGTRAAGAWHLAVVDHAGLDVGTLDAWSMILSPDRAGAAEIHASASDLPRFIPDAPDGDGSGGHVLIKIWARTLHRVVAHSETFDNATAAFVFSEDEHHALSPEEMRMVAYKGRAVSPVTSYLATEPGVRPSTEGLLELDGVGGLGLMGVGRGGGGSGPRRGCPLGQV